MLEGGQNPLDTYIGLFGWRMDELHGWTVLPIGGRVEGLTATLWFLPGGFHESERHRHATYTFTLMCRHPGGSAAACDGHGPGPVATPFSCSISHADYAGVPGDPLHVHPECSDATGTPFDFGAGDRIAVRVQRTGELAGGNHAQWSTSFTPAP